MIADPIRSDPIRSDPIAAGTGPTGGGLTINDLSGNIVILQLRPDLFAFSFHVAPGSTTVEVGDRVTKGRLTGAGLVAEPTPGPRREELPLHESVLDFPAAPS